MCSSPKSSGGVQLFTTSKIYRTNSLTIEQRARFAAVANRADERKQKKLEIERRWAAKHRNNNKKMSHHPIWDRLNSLILSLVSR